MVAAGQGAIDTPLPRNTSQLYQGDPKVFPLLDGIWNSSSDFCVYPKFSSQLGVHVD